MSIAREIRSKIKSIESTKKITHAMELVSASKMKRVQHKMEGMRLYSKELCAMISRFFAANPSIKHPFLTPSTDKGVGFIVLSSKRGLCGGLNLNLFRSVVKEMEHQTDLGREIYPCLVGYKAIQFFGSADIKPFLTIEPEHDILTMEEIIGLVGVHLKAFERQEIGRLYLCFNAFKNSMVQEPQIIQILPLKPELQGDQTLLDETKYSYEPDASFVMEKLLSRYIETVVYAGVLENFTSEQAARMVAMKSSTDNAGSMIADLKLVYNKARQASITQEITEIVSGASALEE